PKRDEFGKITLPKILEKVVITLNKENIYLARDEKITIEFSPEDVTWISSDETIATVENGVITGKNPGTVTITASKKNVSESINVTVTDLITLPKIDNKKDYLKCEQFTEDEAKLLDTLLAYRISEAGENTRAGAVAAARFLALEFPYRIHYFYENGRLITAGGRAFVDGEGRYYHKGLYLSKDKYNDLAKSAYGPKMWGCEMYSKITKRKSPNGLDCSGYVSWALYNAGFDVGDGGAGINLDRDTDLDDLGEKLKINKENLDSKRVKVGDLLSMYGHIGILIGMDDEHYYIAESLTNDIHVLTMTESELLKSDWLQFILLDEVYKEDGNLTNMW
ncbi:MAG: Ig-like domain-containing protein, partial [Bacilli bacterium]|nr:Ig-like domain-containing protein [Bacilli bacterium]